MFEKDNSQVIHRSEPHTLSHPGLIGSAQRATSTRLLPTALWRKSLRPAVSRQRVGRSAQAIRQRGVQLCLAFPDMYELALYQFRPENSLSNRSTSHDTFLADRLMPPAPILEQLMRERDVSLWGWESRRVALAMSFGFFASV